MEMLWRYAVWMLFLALPLDAMAHQVFLSSARITENPDRQISVELSVEGSDLEKVFEVPLTIRGGIVNPHELAKHQTKFVVYLMARMAVANGAGDSCHFHVKKTQESYNAVLLVTKWDCQKTAGELFYQTSLFFDQSATAGQLVFIKGQGKDSKNKTPPLLNAKTPKISITGPPPTFMETTKQFIAASIEHIFIGFDHIAFLVALLLWARRLWSVIKIITAFTVAHTITLTLATLDIVTLPSVFVEAAIAASIIYVAAENFYRRDIEKRWPITFLFGLVHGFGFASVLKDFGLPDTALVTALAMFNVGVEIGQIAIVGIALPVILTVDHLIVRNSPNAPNIRRNPIFIYLASGGIFLLGAYWLIERLV